MGHRRQMQPWKKEQARQMRRRMTPPEWVLWQRINRKQTGYRFRSQAPILGWIADFYCPSVRLVVEVDGRCHENRRAEDQTRDEAMRSYGYRVLRVPARDVFADVNAVVERIRNVCESLAGDRRAP